MDDTTLVGMDNELRTGAEKVTAEIEERNNEDKEGERFLAWKTMKG